jgi:hypothetical protein
VNIGKQGNIQPADIAHASIHPWCHGTNPAFHSSRLSKTSQALLNDAIPLIIRENPDSFPFLLPGMATADQLDQSVAVTGDPAWIQKCK